MTTNPYHDGELLVQQKTRERDAAVSNGRMIADTVPAAAAGFIKQQCFVTLGRTDDSGAVWAILLSGEHGFASVDDDRGTVRLVPDVPPLVDADGPISVLKSYDPVGLLFIEFATRRRLRVNGLVRESGEAAIALKVEQAYPNCPKYIQRRSITAHRHVSPAEEPRRGEALTDELRRWIAVADTFMLATRHPSGAHDANHRGGDAGFVRVDGNRLCIPDYPGNSVFNSFGNLVLDPRAGLVFPDFVHARQLCLSGSAELEIDGPREASTSATGGTGRWWTFQAKCWAVLPLGVVASDQPERSPFNPSVTGVVR